RSIVRYFFRCPWPLRRAIAQPCWVALPSSSSLCRGEYSSARVWLTGLSGGKPPHKKCPYSLKNVEPHYEECESLFEKYQAASRLSIKRVIATYTNVSLVLGNSS